VALQGKTYRLLSEPERKYVARAGTTTPIWWGSSITPQQANYLGIADPYKGGGGRVPQAHGCRPTASSRTPGGLYQVHGNVDEWKGDCWNDRNAGDPGDGSARTTGDCGSWVVHGGSWGPALDGIEHHVAPVVLHSCSTVCWWDPRSGRIFTPAS
jgi:formylglycine-generating enzyme required for sulfatase activity